MTHVIGFDSLDDMFEAMRKATSEANSALHIAQTQLTYGSCWIRFADIKRRIVVFGRVRTLTEVEMAFRQEGIGWTDYTHELTDIAERHDEGYLNSYVADRIDVLGQVRDVHRFDMWPIEGRLYDAALAADWDIERLDTGMQVLVRIAFAEWRAWRRETKARAEGTL